MRDSTRGDVAPGFRSVEGAEGIRHFRMTTGDNRQPKLVVFPALCRGVADVRERHGISLGDQFRVRHGHRFQSQGAAGRQDEQVRHAGVVLTMSQLRAPLFQQGMRIGAAESERVHAHDRRLLRFRQALERGNDPQSKPLKIDGLIPLVKMQGGRNLSMP